MKGDLNWTDEQWAAYVDEATGAEFERRLEEREAAMRKADERWEKEQADRDRELAKQDKSTWDDATWHEYMGLGVATKGHEEWERRRLEMEAAWDAQEEATRADFERFPWKYTENLGANPVHPPHKALWFFEFDDYEENGLPKCESLSRDLNMEVTPAMRDAIWADYYNKFERRYGDPLPVSMTWVEIEKAATGVDKALDRLKRDMRRYSREAHNGKVHVKRWLRALSAFGEDTGEMPMTLAEAEKYSDRGWARWDPVVEQMRKL